MTLPTAKGAAMFAVGTLLAMIAIAQVQKYLVSKGKSIPGLS